MQLHSCYADVRSEEAIELEESLNHLYRYATSDRNRKTDNSKTDTLLHNTNKVMT